MRQKRIIVYELNEVPFRILDHFAGDPRLPPLSAFRRQARAYRTFVEDTGHLSPWVTWPSLHRGVANETHQITDLGMDLTHIDCDHPPLWNILSRAGVRCGVFGSLHSYPLPNDLENHAFFVPDIFAAGPECFPRDYEAFQTFNLKMAEINARDVTSRIALKEAARFLSAAPGLGLRGRTSLKLAGQITSELWNRRRRVRRRTSQVQIAFDFFLKALATQSPDIALFFTNHVASSLHRYWPALFPEDYEWAAYSDAWRKDWHGEIPHAMYEAAEQIDALARFADRNGYVLVVASSMGQEAVQGRSEVTSVALINSLGQLMSWTGLTPAQWTRRPAMNPQTNIWIDHAAEDRFRKALDTLTINGKRISLVPLGEGVHRLEFNINNPAPLEVHAHGHRIAPEEIGVGLLHLADAAGANAYHIPEGSLLVYDPDDRSTDGLSIVDDISTLEIAPSILSNFGVAVPGYMRAPLPL